VSYNFDGVDDLVAGPAMTLGETITILGRTHATSAGGGSQGTVYSHGPQTSRRTALFFRATGDGQIRFENGAATTTASWDTTAYPVTADKTIVVTFDGSAVANNPILYVLYQGVLTPHSVGSGLTRNATRSGGQFADGGALYVGARSNGGSAWAGWIGEVAVWTRILSAAEVAEAVFKGPRATLRGLAAWWSYTMNTGATIYDRSGSGRHGAVTGALHNVYNPRMAF